MIEELMAAGIDDEGIKEEVQTFIAAVES